MQSLMEMYDEARASGGQQQFIMGQVQRDLEKVLTKGMDENEITSAVLKESSNAGLSLKSFDFVNAWAHKQFGSGKNEDTALKAISLNDFQAKIDGSISGNVVDEAEKSYKHEGNVIVLKGFDKKYAADNAIYILDRLSQFPELKIGLNYKVTIEVIGRKS